MILVSFREQLKVPAMANLSFEERLGILVDTEWASRKNNRLRKLIQDARFDQPQAHVADINYSVRRKLDPASISRLASCTYVAEKHNVIIMGAAGSGKSFIGGALGMETCSSSMSGCWSHSGKARPATCSGIFNMEGLGVLLDIIQRAASAHNMPQIISL